MKCGRQRDRADFSRFKALISTPAIINRGTGAGLVSNDLFVLPANANLWIQFSAALNGNIRIRRNASRVIALPTLSAGIFHHLGWWEKDEDFGVEVLSTSAGILKIFHADGIGVKRQIAGVVMS